MCGDDAWLRGKHGSQTVLLTDEGWQKMMPKQIELWDVSFWTASTSRGHAAVTGGKAAVNGGWRTIPRRVSGKERREGGGGGAQGLVVSL